MDSNYSFKLLIVLGFNEYFKASLKTVQAIPLLHIHIVKVDKKQLDDGFSLRSCSRPNCTLSQAIIQLTVGLMSR